jgi:hypothetical protein
MEVEDGGVELLGHVVDERARATDRADENDAKASPLERLSVGGPDQRLVVDDEDAGLLLELRDDPRRERDLSADAHLVTTLARSVAVERARGATAGDRCSAVRR